MIKVLIYSSKEIYEKSSFEGRAEADLIAYREDEEYVILKNRTQRYFSERVPAPFLGKQIMWAEKDGWEREMKSYELKESYRNHPITTLMKNEPTDV